MARKMYYELPEFSGILSFIDAIFRELNMGLLIYHLEEPGEPSTLRLIYANPEASESTGADLQPVVGQRILTAFPNLADSGMPEIFADVASNKESRRVEEIDYGDERLVQGTYRVRAFPMPSDCVGVLFERF